MVGKFLGGVLVGSMVGAAVASQWDTLAKHCPFFAEMKGNMCSGCGDTLRHSAGQHKPQSKTTRLMARRNRMVN